MATREDMMLPSSRVRMSWRHETHLKEYDGDYEADERIQSACMAPYATWPETTGM
jgi:hypothetical protein